MWLKLAGSILVVTAGTALGFSLATSYLERPRQIRQLIGCFTALKTYIGYVAMPLPEALLRSVEGIDGPVRQFIELVAQGLRQSGWHSAKDAVAAALAESDANLALVRPEKELCLILGANLGISNREEQQKYLTMVVEELQRVEQDAIALRDKNVKMYRYLGLCGGLMVAIMLV